MVKSFQFGSLPVIYFQAGKLKSLPEIIMNYGRSVILVTGKDSFNLSPKSEFLLNAFETNGIKCYRVTISGEPGPGMIDEAVNKFRDIKIDSVVGIGGGSVLDAGKAISAMMYKKNSVRIYLEGIGVSEHPGTKLPYITIPTTSGTGSEATKNAVLSETGINGFKKSLRHDRLIPDVALIDPELTLNCPPEITAASGMDCFTQLTEAFLSSKANQYTDALALKGLKSIKSSLLPAYQDGGNLDARSGMSFAALTSGICLANAGLGLVHGFASSIGGMYTIPHGLICGTLMAVTNEINVRILRKDKTNPEALAKYSMIGQLFSAKEGKSLDYYIDEFIRYLLELTKELHLPGLGKSGLTERDLQKIAESTDEKNNPVTLSAEEKFELLKSRFV